MSTPGKPTVLLINPPYQTITSNLGVGHQVPLGLLCVGGSLLDAGCDVHLLDAEARRLSDHRIVAAVRSACPDIVMTGHAGSTPAHPVCMRMLRAIKAAVPSVTTVYGGVWPSYHPAALLAREPAVDIVVCGEGEATARGLVTALNRGEGLATVEGIAWRDKDRPVVNPPRRAIERLDEYRVGWELIKDWNRYRCFGLGRAAIVQFSRGCPHSCSYCGQHQFWERWRHRDPERVVDEIEHLHRVHGVRFITFADENPTTCKATWRDLLERIIARNLDVHFFATIRATDLVRDADMLHLYRKAGMLYVLMGIESTDDAVLREVQKNSTSRIDYLACQLLREHGIFSIIGHITGLGDETWADFRRAAKVLREYDGDYLNAMYATPHSWTAWASQQSERGVVQPNQRYWDYRHPVLAPSHLTPRRLMLAVKWLELVFHIRPRRLWRLIRTNRFRLWQALWSGGHVAGVWVAELVELTFLRHARTPRPLREHLPRCVETVPLTIGSDGPAVNRDDDRRAALRCARESCTEAMS